MIIEMQCKRSVLKKKTQLKVFWGSQDKNNHNYWLHLKNSNVEDFGHPQGTMAQALNKFGIKDFAKMIPFAPIFPLSLSNSLSFA